MTRLTSAAILAVALGGCGGAGITTGGSDMASGHLIVAGNYGSVFAGYDRGVIAHSPSAGSSAAAPTGTLWAIDDAGQRQKVTDSIGAVHSLAHASFAQPTGQLVYWTREHGSVTVPAAGLDGVAGDDAHIAYGSKRAGDGAPTLVIAPLDGTTPASVSNAGATGGHILGLTGGRVVVSWTMSGGDALVAYRADGSATALGTPPASILELAAGKILAREASFANPRLIPVDGSAAITIGASSYAARITPAGDAVVSIDTLSSLVRVPVDGSAPTPLKIDSGSPIDTIFALSADGKSVLYGSGVISEVGPLVEDVKLTFTDGTRAGSRVAEIIPSSGVTVAFTHDSAWIVYSSSSPQDQDGGLWALAVGGGLPRKLGQAHWTPYVPAGSPAAPWLVELGAGAHVVWQDDGGALWTVDLDRSDAPRKLTGAVAAASITSAKSWAVSADGKTIYWAEVAGLFAAALD